MDTIPGFKLNPFCRIVWSNQKIKDKWEPLLEKAADAFRDVELLTVQEGVRTVSAGHILPDDLPSTVQKLGKKGVSFVPIMKVGKYEGYTHFHPKVEENKVWSYFGAFSKDSEAAAAFCEAHDVHDHETMGNLLGFPDCCIKHFSKVWRAGVVDPVWQAALNTKEDGVVESSDRYLSIRAYPEAISALRYKRIRMISHIPCSATCESTRDVALKWEEVAKKHGLAEDFGLLREILSWPIEWSVLHGIAEVKTPLFKISTNSMATYEKHTIHYQSDNMPDESPTGVSFPYRLPNKMRMTEHPAFKRAETEITVD